MSSPGCPTPDSLISLTGAPAILNLSTLELTRMLSLPVLQPLETEWERVLSLRELLESKFMLDTQYAQTMKGHLEAARLDFPETSYLRPTVDALMSSITQEINHRLESNDIFRASLATALNALRRDMLVQNQTYNTLSQASDLTKTKLLVDRELALSRDPGPSSPKATRIENRFLHRRGRSKEANVWTANSLEAVDMVRYLGADMRLRRTIAALIIERADFRVSMPQTIESLAANFQDALENLCTMLKRYAERQLDFASTTNQQASTLLLKIQDISPHRDTFHLQEQMEAKQQSQSLFDEIVYVSPAFPMFHQDPQPIIFGMRLRNEDKFSMEAITVFKSLIARGVDWVHFVKCMALPSAYRDYPTAKHVNELEQGWSLGSLWRNSFVARLSAQDSAQLLLLYLEFLPDPLFVIDKELAGVIESQNLYMTEKVLVLVRKWRKNLQGDLASAILACWKPFRYASNGSPNLGRDWQLLANILTRGEGIFQQKLFLTLVERFDDAEETYEPPLLNNPT